MGSSMQTQAYWHDSSLCKALQERCKNSQSLFLWRQIIGVVGNYTLDFDYYGPFEEYSQWVADYPSCYFTNETGKQGNARSPSFAVALPF